ncbi:MAG: hypothetical protein V4574_08515 [Pseudomonadota bacterium]
MYYEPIVGAQPADQAVGAALDHYLLTALSQNAVPIRMIAASPSAPLAQAVHRRLDAVRSTGTAIEIVFATHGRRDWADIAAFVAAAGADRVRIARFAGARHLVEQLILGTELWTASRVADDGGHFVPAAKGAFGVAAAAAFDMVFALADPLQPARLAA